ncbi:MAG: thiamine ABC transporter substrate-binding protein [Chloroflexi bacterium]|nr:thiamine ABC transporter substrate-binding protein [Chloroflexota bacterium]
MNRFAFWILTPLTLIACQPAPARSLTVMTHGSFAVSEDLIRDFESDYGTKVVFIQAGDAGEVLNKAILTQAAPLADVLFGVDNTFLSRALEAGIFEPYRPSLLEAIPDEFELDDSNRATPVDYADVCINYDRDYFLKSGLTLPASLEDLLKPEYEGLLVVENPATSSPGLAFLLATRAHFGEEYLAYWAGLKNNGVVVVDGWETAYYTNFSGSSGQGDQPLVVSYGSSPAAEVWFAEPPRTDAPTASIIGPDTCFRQMEFVGILKGTRNRALAEGFIDFMLSVPFQENMPLQMFVYPVNQDASLPEVFIQFAQVPDQPAVLDPEMIAAHRDEWIEAWTKTMKED